MPPGHGGEQLQGQRRVGVGGQLGCGRQQIYSTPSRKLAVVTLWDPINRKEAFSVRSPLVLEGLGYGLSPQSGGPDAHHPGVLSDPSCELF